MGMAQFGSLIAEHRERLGLSTSRLAELIGRAPSSIRAWEKGRSTPNDAVVVTLDPVELLSLAAARVPRAFTAEECTVYRTDPCPTFEELRSGS